MSLCPEHLRRALLNELAALPFAASLELVATLLDRMGYENVRMSGRSDFIGHNQGGGADLTAGRRVPGGTRFVVIQLKRYPEGRHVYRRSLDELRGVALRLRAAEGIVIATSGFSPSVPVAEYASDPTAPLRLIDGAELADLLVLYRVGVLKVANPGNVAGATYQIDTAFFHRLEARHRAELPVTTDLRLSGVDVRIIPRSRNR